MGFPLTSRGMALPCARLRSSCLGQRRGEEVWLLLPQFHPVAVTVEILVPGEGREEALAGCSCWSQP